MNPLRISDNTRAANDPAPALVLQFGGGGGNYGGMDAVDAKIAAAEARTDTKFAQVIGRLDRIDSDIGQLRSSVSGIIPTVIVTGIAAVTLVVAIFGWGTSMFGSGMDIQTAVDRTAVQFEERWATRMSELDGRIETMDVKFNDIADKLDVLLAASGSPTEP